MKRIVLLVVVMCVFLLCASVAFGATQVGTPAQLREALVNGARIELTNDIELDYTLLIKELNDVIIRGNGFAIKAAPDFSIVLRPNISHPRQLVNVVCSEVTFESVVLKSGSENSHVLNVASLTRDSGGSEVTLIDVMLDRSTPSAVGGAPLIINTSRVVVAGSFTVIGVGANTWYGIGISNWDTGASATLEFSDGLGALPPANTVWELAPGIPSVVDAQGNNNTVINPEGGGLVSNEDGTFWPDEGIYEPRVPVESIEVEPEKVLLFVGGSEKLEITILPENATYPYAMFKSENDSVASIDDEGIVTAHGVGKTSIAVSVNPTVLIPVEVYESAKVTLDPMNGINEPVILDVPIGLPLTWLTEGWTGEDFGLTKEGYAFGGWWTEPTGGVRWNWDTDIVEGDMTLYAQWVTDQEPPPVNPLIPPAGDVTALGSIATLGLLGCVAISATLVRKRFE